jgi:hypothetical protein
LEDGRWKMEDGRWKMEDGRWKMEDGRWKMNVTTAAVLAAVVGEVNGWNEGREIPSP